MRGKRSARATPTSAAAASSVRFRRADVGTPLEHAGGQAGGQLRRRFRAARPRAGTRPSTISRGDAPEQHRERVRATRGLELELLLRRAGRGHLRLHALERELVALAAFLADALDAQRLFAVGERLARVRKLLRRGLQRDTSRGRPRRSGSGAPPRDRTPRPAVAPARPRRRARSGPRGRARSARRPAR